LYPLGSAIGKKAGLLDGFRDTSTPLLINAFPPSFVSPHKIPKTPSEPPEKLQEKFTKDPGDTATVDPRYLEVNWKWLAARRIEN